MKLPAFLLRFSIAFGLLLASGIEALRAEEVPNFALPRATRGRSHELHRVEGRAVVLFFTGVGCPVARKSAGKLLELKRQFKEDVTVWLVDSELDADPAAVGKEAAELGLTSLPVLLDPKQGRWPAALASSARRKSSSSIRRTGPSSIAARWTIN